MQLTRKEAIIDLRLFIFVDVFLGGGGGCLVGV